MNKDGKITKATNDKVARENALKDIQLNGFVQVGNWSFAKTVVNAENKDTVVRIDIVVPKLEVGVTAEDMADDWTQEKEIKELELKAVKDAKEKAKASKKK